MFANITSQTSYVQEDHNICKCAETLIMSLKGQSFLAQLSHDAALHITI